MLAGMMLTTSCGSYLDEDPKGQLTSTTFFKNQSELDMAVYAMFRAANKTSNSTLETGDRWQGDDITTNPGSNKQVWAEFDRFTTSDANRATTTGWNAFYSLIKAANYIILNASNTPTTSDEINIALGQAKYWRAYAYFRLVRTWGPVPICETTEIDYNAKLSPVEDIYAQIIKDLTDAISFLPTNYTTAPRKIFGVNAYVTKQAAQATRAAVYMAMAGFPLNKGTECYKLAAADAKAVIDGEDAYGFKLDTDFSKVYAPSNNYNMETVIGLGRTQIFGWSDEANEITLSDLFESQGGWGDCWGEIKFWKNMPDCPRKDAIYCPKILYGNTTTTVAGTYKGQLVNWYDLDDNGNKIIPEYHPMISVNLVGKNKVTYNYAVDYEDFDYTKGAASSANSNAHRCRLIRYSEVLLWYAESQARADGAPNNLAYQCINRVRERAGLSDLPAGMNGNDFAEAAMKEHGWEVACYWIGMVSRRDDQLRMNTLKETFADRLSNKPIVVAVVNGKEIKAAESVAVTATAWTDDMNYAQYPNSDYSLNPNLKRTDLLK